MAIYGDRWLASVRIPQPDRAVNTGTCQSISIRRKRQGPDFVRMLLHCGFELSAVRVPQPDLAVPISTGQGVPIRRIGNGTNGIPPQGDIYPAGVGIP